MLKESILVSLLSFLVSIITFINQVILAQFFGAGILMDVYLSASSIPTLVAGLIGASLSYSLTPHLIKMRLENDESVFGKYALHFFLKLVFYSGLLYTAGAVLSAMSIQNIFSAINDDNLKLAHRINIASWISSFFFTLLAFSACYFNAFKNFKFPIILSFLPYCGSIISCILLYQKFSILSIVIGLVAGGVIACVISFLIIFKSIPFVALKNGLLNKSINSYFLKVPVICIAMLSFSVYQTIDAYWAPKIGNAALSYLGYCQRILIAVGTLVIVGPSTVLVPRLTQAISEKREHDFLKDAALVIKLVIALSSVVALIGSILGTHVITVLFERGAFSATDTAGIATILPFMLSGMVFMLCVVVLFRALFVKQMINTVAILGLTCAALYFLLSGIGSHFAQLKGIAAAYIITWFIIFAIALYHIFKRSIEVFFNKKTFHFFTRQILILIIVGLFTAMLQVFSQSFTNNHFWKSFTVLAFSGTGGMLIYFFLSLKIIKQEEVIILFNPLLKREKAIIC